MEWYDIEVDGRRTVKFPAKTLAGQNKAHESRNAGCEEAPKVGGIIKRGEWAWLAQGCSLHIVSLRNGQTMSTFEFAESKGFDSCCIRCVEEIFPGNTDSVLLAVCLESFRGPGGGGFVALYSVEFGRVLSCMELRLHATCVRYMAPAACRRSLLQNFDGCLAVGSEEGVVVLIDLNMRKLLALHAQHKPPPDEAFVACHIVDYNLPITEIHRKFRQCQQDVVHFGLQMEVVESACSIQCILPIDLILGLAVGLDDGRLVMYDLPELQIFYIGMPQRQQEMSPLVKMDFLEPPDDPRPCIYIWALHENGESLMSVLHTFMYEKRSMVEDDDDFYFFETFQSSSVRLQFPLENSKSVPISCQSISTVSAEDDSNCLFALTWFSELDEKNKLLIFDLNQYYKEEMPFVLDRQKNPSYLAAYTLNGQRCALDTYLNPSTIAHFNSMQRFEEHFYPNSLSFDCSLLMTDSCRSYNREGAQNKFINILRSSTASVFLEPDTYFNEILRTRLMPQFVEVNLNSTFSRNAKYEILLSVALENNCFSLLRDCAKCWADGSFTGNFSASTGISLRTLTEWIWKRATDIKTRCNDLCKGIFGFGVYPLDRRELKELGFITRQLKLLANLLAEVLAFSKRILPPKVFSNLDAKYKSLCMAGDYQDILLWLLNIGLLPETPYPYDQLKEMYTNKRTFFAKISESFVSKKSGSCRLIYIDSFIEHECKGNVLREYWLENNGDGLYPPTSIEAMLRIMLVPEVGFESKCAILLYFFLDLHSAFDEHGCKDLVTNFIKFPSVFKLSASLIKTVQAFWNLDHGHFMAAVDEFISPFNNNQHYPQWQLELLIETLLTQNSSNLALRILEARPMLISPVLKMKTLLSNELISEAFHFVRSKYDDSLLELFFSCCLCAGKFSVIRDLALSEKEGQLVQNILKRSKTPGAENLHLVYLLQKSKYIEAVSFMDELSKSKCNLGNLNIDTPNLVLSAFNTTMTPVTQGLTDVYFRIKNKIKKKEADNKSPVPLSCQLIKQNANNLLGGIYHSSALSAHFATYYWGEIDSKKPDSNALLNSNNAPFLRKPQIETHFSDFVEKNAISYPQVYKPSEKRTLSDSDLHNSSDDIDRLAQQNPKKRRRMLGQDIVNDLSHFMQMNKDYSRLNVNEFSFAASVAKPKESGADSFLTRPPAKRQQIGVDSVKKGSSLEIQGILKTNTPEPTVRLGLRRDLPAEEEKNLRFALPSPERDLSVAEHRVEDEVIAELQHIPASKKTNKKVSRSISVESSVSSSSSKAISEENFYSPLSSRNTSLIVDSGRASSTFDSSTMDRAHSKHSFASGPQPRKALARLSAERSEKALTPEPWNKVNKERSPVLAEKPICEAAVVVDSKYSSGFDSFSFKTTTAPISSASSSRNLEITSVISLASKINEFVPQVSSSKVCETQSKFSTEKSQTHLKLSECSTVIGGFSTIETTAESSKIFAMPSVPIEKSQPKEPQMLDATLGMSSYDFTVLDTTALQQADTEIRDAAPQEESVAEVTSSRDNYGEEEKMELEESDLYEISLGIDNRPSHNEKVCSVREDTVAEHDHANDGGEESDVIVLLSSSSSSSSSYLSETAAESEETDEEQSEDQEDDVDRAEGSEEDDEEEWFGDNNEVSTNSESIEILGDAEEDDYYNDTDDMLQVGQNSDSDEEQDQNKTNRTNQDDEQEVLITEHSDEKLTVEEAPIEQESAVAEETELQSRKSEEPETSVPQSEQVEEKQKLIDEEQEQDVPIANDALMCVVSECITEEVQDAEDTEIVSAAPSNDNSEMNDVVLDTSESTTTALVSDEMLFVQAQPEGISAMFEVTECLPDELMQVQDEAIENNNSIEVKGELSHLTEGIAEKPIETTEIIIHSEKAVTEESPSQAEYVNVGKLSEPIDDPKPETNTREVEEQIVMRVDEVEEQIVLRVDEDDLSDYETEKPAESKEPSPPVLSSEEKSPTVQQNLDSNDKKSVSDAPKENKGPEQVNEDATQNVAEAISEETSIQRGDAAQQDEKAIEAEKETVAENVDEENSAKDDPIQPPSLSENKTEEQLNTPPRKRTTSFTKILETEYATPRTRRALRESSIPPAELVSSEVNISTPRRRNTRGISVPPQIHAESEDNIVYTPRTRRNIRASSLQPKPLLDDQAVGDVVETGTPQRRLTRRESSVPPQNAANESDEVSPKLHARDTSTQSAGVPAKIPPRRRSVLLDAITEGTTISDSPSQRTRSRLRLNSMDSELDSSIISNDQPQAKRTRRTSVSSSVSEQPHMSQKTGRRSVTSQAEGSTPVLGSAPKYESNESSEATPKRASSKRKITTASKLDSTVIDESGVEDAEAESPKATEKSSPIIDMASSSSYSTSRRLTRTQLAMFEKAAAITERSAGNLSAAIMSPTIAKRISKRRASRSTTTTNHDSDDAQSMSSHVSNFSNPNAKRMVTRSSVVDKDEVRDDDLASVASSRASGRLSKRRSKESKSSPNTTLTAIPEDDSEAHILPKKRGRPTKK